MSTYTDGAGNQGSYYGKGRYKYEMGEERRKSRLESEVQQIRTHDLKKTFSCAIHGKCLEARMSPANTEILVSKYHSSPKVAGFLKRNG